MPCLYIVTNNYTVFKTAVQHLLEETLVYNKSGVIHLSIYLLSSVFQCHKDTLTVSDWFQLATIKWIKCTNRLWRDVKLWYLPNIFPSMATACACQCQSNGPTTNNYIITVWDNHEKHILYMTLSRDCNSLQICISYIEVQHLLITCRWHGKFNYNCTTKMYTGNVMRFNIAYK